MFKKILLPHDGSSDAEHLADWVVGFAEAVGADVALLTVVDPNGIALPNAVPDIHLIGLGKGTAQDSPGGGLTPGMLAGVTMGAVRQITTHIDPSERPPEFGTQIIERSMESARIYLLHESKRLQSSGVTITTRVEMGAPAELIVEQAKKLGADMIAMATHRGSAIAREVLNSVSDKVVRTASMPVLVVHPKSSSRLSAKDGKPSTVIVPVDGSERSRTSVPMAIEIAKTCESNLLFMTAVEFPNYAVIGEESRLSLEHYGLAERKRPAAARLEEIVCHAREQGVEAKFKVTAGSASQRIIEQVKEEDTPLVVITTRGESGIERLVLGSVTDKVIESSGAPVLVMREMMGGGGDDSAG